MRHQCRAARTVPMRLSSRYVNHITHLQLSRLLAFGADEAGAHRYCEDLTAFVGMPKGSSSRRKADIVAHTVFSIEYWVHVDGASEGLGRLARSRVRLVCGAYELHCGGVLSSVSDLPEI